ncbi:methyl-accepting chemotaxis protein [Aureimonas sp. ME7]|uniref:methyl-accepting chemotaxis protein n=1 Tax=Aureimonas sp. ME7 TaxID=2744252 RepID=UPI001FCEA8D0|nr:methyl-accepting chemotaxis protein [Aureimonas sp. ME7]
MSISVFRGSLGAQKQMALDELATNVMLADKDLRITFVNKTLIALLGEAEADLRKELPAFKVADLVGSSIDIFHKHPAHQRKLLETLEKPYRATIRVGDWVFDLLVTPLRERGRITGFGVEWANAKERLANIDYSAQIAAIHRSQLVIEFRVDGTIAAVNDNFLQATGYARSELIGRNHSILVGAQERAGAAYAEFWEALRAGRFQASEFRRVAKDGSDLWIQGSYNPILDANGKVAKIVQFATDVTTRVQAVSRVGSALGALANGQLDREIGEALTPELDQLRIDYNEARTTLCETIQEVQGASTRISERMTEISMAANDLSQRTEQQAAALEETVAAISQVTQGVKETTSEAGRAQATAAAALSNAQRGEEIVAAAIEAMNAIKGSSQKIGKIIGVIDDIAFQTNLLALNAGVEAARAGEAGKGFAVVAQEVRGLAQRSAEAAKEIKDLISRSSAQVDGGVDLVSSSGRSIQEIVGQVGEMNRVISLIAQSARDQSVSLSEVATAANQVDKVTQQNAAMVEQTTAATRDLLGETAELTQRMARFETGSRPGAKTALSIGGGKGRTAVSMRYAS